MSFLRCVSRYSTPAAGGSPPALHLPLSGQPARQLAVTCTLAVDPQGVDTNTWRPALVSRDVNATVAPLSVTLVTVLPAGSVAPICRLQARADLTVVVQVFPLWVAVTSIEPVPTLMLLPDTVD